VGHISRHLLNGFLRGDALHFVPGDGRAVSPGKHANRPCRFQVSDYPTHQEFAILKPMIMARGRVRIQLKPMNGFSCLSAKQEITLWRTTSGLLATREARRTRLPQEDQMWKGEMYAKE
jgi:hypothetical protein